MQMQFRDGTAVYTANGDHIGQIDRVVIDPLSKEVTHVVIEQGVIFTTDKVLPVQLVASATDEQVRLKPDVTELEELPDFQQTHYVGLNERELQAMAYPTQGHATPFYGYPPFGAAFYDFPGYVGPGGTSIAEPDYAQTTREQIPENTTALREGARVFSADEQHVGEVERLFVDEETNKATHLVISQGLFLKSHKLIPISWARQIMEDSVYLGVQAHTLEELPDFQTD